MTNAPEQTPEQQLEEAGKAAISLRNDLDRMTADRNYHADLAESWKAQFHSAAAAASEYSEFWEAHQGEFDSFGNYIPHSQIDGDLRAAKAEIERLNAECFALAANQCHAGYGDDYGNHRCRKIDALAKDLADAVNLLHDLLGLVPGSGEAAFAFIERHMLGAVGTGGKA